MSEESGFEVARAYVAVSPDASDFAAALDEQLGGISLAVLVTPDAANFASAFDEQVGGLSATATVTPDASDFASAVDEQTGGLTASVTLLVDPEGASDFGDMVSEQAGAVAIPVTAVPDVTDFGDMLGEETAGTVVPVTVVPDASDFDERLNEEVGTPVVNVSVQPAGIGDLAEHLGGVGAMPVTVTPDVSDFAQQLDEETGGLTVSAAIVPDVSGLQDQIDEAAGDLTATLTVDADTTRAVTAISGLEAEAADDSGIQTLYNGILSIGPAATQAEMEAVDALGGIRDAAETAVPADAITEPFAAVGPAAQSMASEVTSSLGEADSGIETFLGGIYSLGPSADAAQSQLADSMGNARQSVADAASAMGSVDYSAASDGLSGVAGAAGDVADAAPAAADAAGGLSGVLGELAGRMSYMAVDPFMWMYAAPLVISGVTAALQALGGASDGYMEMLTKQDQATQYNISGYQKLAGQLAQTADSYSASSKSAENSIGQWGSDASAVFASLSQNMSAASQQVAAEALNIGDHLTTLESTYGLTATQAEQLATAAGVSAQQLAGGGAAAEAAMAKIEAYANTNIGAAGPVNELAGDVSTFGNDALTASVRVGALDDAYNMLTGRLVASQQGMLAVAQDFLNIQAGAETAGASMSGTNQQSLALQQSFYATAGAIEQTANAMTQQGDSSAQVTAYIQEQTDKLSGLTGGNQQAQQAVQGLRQWEDNLRGSVDTTSAAILTSAGNLQNSFIKQLEDAGAKSSVTKTDVDELTNSILATGDKSDATKAARAQLIADLEKAGVNAQQATKLVDQFTKSIQNIPSSKTVSIIETATGTITINEATQTASTQGTGGGATFHGASGGHVGEGSAIPRADDVAARLSRNEYVVQAPAVDKYGVGMLDSINAMHFADGGYAGDLSGLGAWTGTQVAGLQSGFTAQMEALLEAAVAAGKPGGTSGRAPVIVNFYGTQVPGPEQMHAITTQLSAAVGVS